MTRIKVARFPTRPAPDPLGGITHLEPEAQKRVISTILQAGLLGWITAAFLAVVLIGGL